VADRKNINTLTGLRGIAALWVFAAHLHTFIGHLYEREFPLNNFFYHGYFGVDIFFILSGFIMTYVHYDDFRISLTEKLKYFLTLRFWRISRCISRSYWAC
jgi:peptidoglycan/LPS O-acetylase OafA/YrhL